MPSEIEDPKITLKCAIKVDEQVPEHPMGPGKCGQMCSLNPNTETALATADAEGVDQDRFCLYSCKPFQETLGGICVDLSNDQRINVETDGGNGEDISAPPLIPEVSTPAKPPGPPPPPSIDSLPCFERRDCVPKLQGRVAEKIKGVWQKAQKLSDEARALAKKAPPV